MRRMDFGWCLPGCKKQQFRTGKRNIMKINILFVLALFSLVPLTAGGLQANDRIGRWESMTPTGPSRSHHWSRDSKRRDTSMHHVRSTLGERRNGHRHRGGGAGNSWRKRHGKSIYYIYRQPNYNRYEEPPTEQVVIEREKRVPVYIPIQQAPSKLQCGGSTLTRKDPNTGELIIEYVSSARDC